MRFKKNSISAPLFSKRTAIQLAGRHPIDSQLFVSFIHICQKKLMMHFKGKIFIDYQPGDYDVWLPTNQKSMLLLGVVRSKKSPDENIPENRMS